MKPNVLAPPSMAPPTVSVVVGVPLVVIVGVAPKSDGNIAQIQAVSAGEDEAAIPCLNVVPLSTEALSEGLLMVSLLMADGVVPMALAATPAQE